MTFPSFFVTGAAGFIGSCICNYFEQQSISYLALDDLSSGSISNLLSHNSFVQLDCASSSVGKLLVDFKPSHIVHLAGQSSGEKSFDDPLNDLFRNVVTTSSLLSFARNLSSLKSFTLASSMAVYGNCHHSKECDPLNPLSYYGMHKLMAEMELNKFSYIRNDVSCNALRLFNVYGIGQNLSDLRQGMVSIFIALAVSQGHIEVKGSLSRTRSFVHVDDVISAIIAASNRIVDPINNPLSSFSAFNVASPEFITVGDLAQIIQEFTDCTFSESAITTPHDQFFASADISLISSQLGWIAHRDLRNSIAEMIEWAKSAIN